jgi:YD repeat-containing protein
MHCNECGVVLDPSEEQVNTTVDQILETSLKDAQKKGGVCPLCGHSKDVPYSHRKTVLFGLLLACLTTGIVVAIGVQQRRRTERAAAARDAVARMSNNPEIVRLLGSPIQIQSGLQGELKRDETGWKELRITVPVRGPNGDAIAHIVGGESTGPWVFTTFEVDFAKQHKKVDLVSGRILEYDPNGYVEVHAQAVAAPEYTATLAASPRFDGEFPCVFAMITESPVTPQLGKCSMPTAQGDPIDRFETDLRYGSFVLRETDLFLNDVFKVPLTRAYNSKDWLHHNPVHAFGRNSNHPYDIAPLGSRNPYTYQMIVLEDGDFLHFDRISRGSGYAGAVFQHTETSTRFYKATTRWDGHGWTTKFADGSEILFPESYNAANAAQGAAYEMRDAEGNRLELHRDPKRNLQEIKTPHGRSIKFSYDDLSRIIRAEAYEGEWARYDYNAAGMLKTVTLSSGRERHYEYDGISLMRLVMDEKGRVLIRNWYSGRLLVRQRFGNGAIYSYRYDWSPDEYFPKRVWVTLPDGTTRELSVGDSVPEYLKHTHR